MSSSSSVSKIQIALVAHDARKDTLVSWVGKNLDVFENVTVVSTETTGKLLAKTLPGINVTTVKSGPLGGDQQIGAMICEQLLAALIFFVYPLSPMPHDVDVKALTRLATIYDLRSTIYDLRSTIYDLRPADGLQSCYGESSCHRI